MQNGERIGQFAALRKPTVEKPSVEDMLQLRFVESRAPDVREARSMICAAPQTSWNGSERGLSASQSSRSDAVAAVLCAPMPCRRDPAVKYPQRTRFAGRQGEEKRVRRGS